MPLPASESCPTTEQYSQIMAGYLADFHQMDQALTEQDFQESDRDDLGYEQIADDGIVNHVLGESNGEVNI